MDFKKRLSGLLMPKRPTLIMGGHFHVEHVRDGKVIDRFSSKNIIVNQGLDYALGVAITGISQIGAWYLAPFGSNYTPVGTDTAASISGNSGESTAYTGSSRGVYQGVEGSQQVTNAAAPTNFTFTGPATIYGAFLISSQAQGSTSGILFAASQFSTPKNVAAQDQLLMTYAFGAQSA